MTEEKPRCASLEVFLQTQRKEGPAERNRNMEIMRGVYGKAS